MRLGVIGGLGPMATAYFMELVISMTKAECDQDHLEMIIYNCPEIPDRTKYILGQSKDNPLPKMLEIGQRLKEQNVDIIAIPCITAHFFHNELSQGIAVPVIHGIRQTAQCLKDAGVERVGVLATDGTITSGIFQTEIEALGMQALIPDEKNQSVVMKMIYDDVKAGKLPEQEEFMDVKRHLVEEKGAQAVVLGCTELSVIKKAYNLGDGIIDTLEVLAQSALKACKKEINPQYYSLVVPLK